MKTSGTLAHEPAVVDDDGAPGHTPHVPAGLLPACEKLQTFRDTPQNGQKVKNMFVFSVFCFERPVFFIVTA